MLRELIVVTLCLGVHGASYDIKQNITGEGYPVEIHHVTTSDGYILELHRIPYSSTNGSNTESTANSTRPAVLLMHSILAASNSFIYAGPKIGIAYSLVNAGYDVWMGNARGNRYSRRHVTLDPDKDKYKFFDFSYEEISLFDLPAIIDYVLATTNQQKLHYIGHTQGGSLFLVLNSMNTTYQSKFASAHLLAGIGYQKHFPNAKIKLFCSGIDLFYVGLLGTGNVELFPSELTTKILGTVINITIPYELVAGGSWKQAVHYCQNFRDESFNMFNYGAVINLSKYGNVTPPSYDLSKIKVNTTLHYSLNDTLLGYQDVLAMADAMPNARAHRIARDDFNHLDYLAAEDVVKLVTDYIINSYNKS